MARVHRSVVSLRIMGDELVPDKISELLGCQPTHSQILGEKLIGKNTGKERIAKLGMWRLEASESIPENVNAQVAEILSKLSNDLEVWSVITRAYKVDLFFGLFLGNDNEGFSISPNIAKEVGLRGIEIDFDIYSL